jgi:hypothetical protein
MSAGHSQCHRKLSGPGAKLQRISRSSRFLHLLDAFDRLQSADQYKAQTFSLHENVKHPVRTVTEIDIGRPGLMTRDKSSRTRADDRMAGFISIYVVGFRFDYDSGERAPLQPAPNQFPCATERVTLKERTLQHGCDFVDLIDPRDANFRRHLAKEDKDKSI